MFGGKRLSFSRSKNNEKKEENSELKELVLVVKTNKGNVESAIDRIIQLAGKFGEDEKRIAIFNSFKENEAFASLKDKALNGEKGSHIRLKALTLFTKLAGVNAQMEPIFALVSREVSFLVERRKK